ncbi:DUF899 domain-containing protein [Promicromonospora sukumoe]|uniref:DUF899 domain-containing protein n=1 Tax=Promicromonospora sukumoe TaxID=88382 RepID=UPI00364C2083
MERTDLPAVVSPEDWLVARKELLAAEKELTRLQDRLAADRRRLPMVRVDKDYRFEGPDGSVSLLDLFDGRPQLVLHHFMWLWDRDADGVERFQDRGCPSCASAADMIPEHLRQLHARNTTLVAVSRAPYEKLTRYADDMGWTFPWFSSLGSDFNYDFYATVDPAVAPVMVEYRTEAELAEVGLPWGEDWRTPGDQPGVSAFLRDGDDVFHTYSTYGRGIQEFHYGIPWLDLTALGRQEAWEEPRGRAVPLGRQVGGPDLRYPDEYDQPSATHQHHHG